MTDFFGTIAKVETLVDTTVRIKLDIQPPDDAVDYGALMATLRQGQTIKLVPLSDEEHQPQVDCTCWYAFDDDGGRKRQVDSECPTHGAVKRDYGQEARELRLSGFCRSPDVWKALGLCAANLEQNIKSNRVSVDTVENNVWASLRDAMQVDSMKHCPPERLREWATEHSVERYLPESYR